MLVEAEDLYMEELSIKHRASKGHGWLQATGVSLAIALAVIAPFFWMGNVSGHDFGFHLSSWLDAAGQWKEGIIFPRWAELAKNGSGEPRFIFYPPLSWMLGTALSFVLPWKAVPCAFIAFAQTLAGLSSYALARRFLSNRAALLAIACYATNPFGLLDIYLRSAFGELLACAFLPLVMLAALELSGIVQSRRPSQSSQTALFAIAFAAVWLSDVPAGIMTSYSVALLFAWAAVAKKALRPLWNGAGGLALGFGLAGFYLLPAIYEQRWVNIGHAVSERFRLRPFQNFFYTQLFESEHTVFSWLVSTVAILVITMTGVAAIALHKRIVRRQEDSDTARVWRALLLLSAAATFLMLRGSSIFWRSLPKLHFVQFPWRFTAILAIPYAFFLAGALAPRRSLWVWSAALAAILGVTTVFIVQNGKSQSRWGRHEIAEHLQWIAKDRGLGGAGEYEPLTRDYWNLQEEPRTKLLDASFYAATDRVPRVLAAPVGDLCGPMPPANVWIHRWTAEEKDIYVTSAWPVVVAARLTNYPAWRVEVNGKVVRPQRSDFTVSNMMVVWAPPGISEIHIRLSRTPDRTLGIVLSVSSIVILTLIYMGRGLSRRTEIELRLEPVENRDRLFLAPADPAPLHKA